MTELKSFSSERIYWAVEQAEQEAGDIADLHLDDNLFCLKSEADKAIENIVKGAVSMFMESSCCRGLDMKSALGRIANAALKHWNRAEYIESNVRQLRLDKAQLLSSNEVLRLHLKSQTSARLTDKIEYALSIRHQKYKRCLAMAKLCAKNVDHLNSEGYIYEKEGRADEVNDCIKGTQFYHKWYERWLKIAKQFEEAPQ